MSAKIDFPKHTSIIGSRMGDPSPTHYVRVKTIGDYELLLSTYELNQFGMMRGGRAYVIIFDGKSPWLIANGYRYRSVHEAQRSLIPDDSCWPLLRYRIDIIDIVKYLEN